MKPASILHVGGASIVQAFTSACVRLRRNRRPTTMMHIIGTNMFLVLVLSMMRANATEDMYRNARTSTRIVHTRYGQLQGIVLSLDNYKYLRPVEAHLGVPYATPPIKSNRFSPTRAPLPWEGVFASDRFSPVCPQRLPDIRNETSALGKMPKGRLEYLRRLLPMLRSQSEDCLYLNVFAPLHAATVETKLPVIVFLHGESFEWNGGNPYDGTVLASYGDVVVVTLNYRLGILGFLNANPAPHLRARVANYGLMDQIAALQWVKENIAKFGGDANMVTLAGHGSGAACINFLMTSPTMVQDLFHRAILLSGSSASSWALVEEPATYAVQLARAVNCPVPDDLVAGQELIVDCLRNTPLDSLLQADIEAPNYLTAFGPSVDGVVIRQGLVNLHDDDDIDAEALYGKSDHDESGRTNGGGNGGAKGANAHDAVGRFDLLFGVVTGEALWRFSAADVQSGFDSERRDRILRTYVRNAYTYHLSEIFYTVVNEYTDWERTAQHPINTRDAAVAALSDAQFVAPLVHTGDALAPLPAGPGQQKTGPKCFFYVFDYQTKDGDYPQRMGTVHGEDLPYVFGAPLVDGFSHFPSNYTKSEVALSEALMVFWSNFARTGNPNEHHRQDSVLVASKERNRFRSIVWEEYDPVHQKYLEIGMKPRMKNHFRAHQLSIWLRLIPELHRAGMEDVIARHNLFRNHDDTSLYEGALKPNILKRFAFLGSDNALPILTGNSSITTVEPASLTTCIPLGNYTLAWQRAGSRTTSSASHHHRRKDGTSDIAQTDGGDLSAAGFPITSGNGNGAGGAADAALSVSAGGDGSSTSTLMLGGFEPSIVYSTALSVTIAIGCSLLVLNVLIFAGVYYQRDRARLEVKTMQQHRGGSIMGGNGSAFGSVGMMDGGSSFDAIKHVPQTHQYSHYHESGSGGGSVIVDVEGSMMLQPIVVTDNTGHKSAAAVPHICGSAMHLKALSSCNKLPMIALDRSGGGRGTDSGENQCHNAQTLNRRLATSPDKHHTNLTTAIAARPMKTMDIHNPMAPAAMQHQHIDYNYATSQCGKGQSGIADNLHNKPSKMPLVSSKTPPKPPIRMTSPADKNTQQQADLKNHNKNHHHCHQRHQQHQLQEPDLFHMHPMKSNISNNGNTVESGETIEMQQLQQSTNALPTQTVQTSSIAPAARSCVLPHAAITEIRQ